MEKSTMNEALLGVLAFGLLCAPAGAADTNWLIKAKRVYTADREPIEDGWVQVGDGRIRAVSAVSPGGGFETLEVDAVTPGLIDLSVRIDLGFDSVEQSTETPARLEVENALDLWDPRFERELRSGVTSVLVSPPDRAVIGGWSVALKTGGPPTLERRRIAGRAALRAAIGDEPSDGNRPAFFQPDSFYNRRPTTRMGVEWVLRKAFHDALAARSDAARATSETQVYEEVLSGKAPLIVSASTTQDIRTACFLQREFKLPRLILDAAAEAWKDPPMVVASGASVVLPPLTFGGRGGNDFAFHSWNSAALLHERGLTIALSGHNALERGERLAAQPGLAMHAGLPFDAALAAVTINPARMIGIDGRVGSIAVGKDADLVLWDGKPFEPSSRIVGVLLEGELVLDPRTAK
ncbi:MAG: amidohydrolase family protein [Planctomycetes bacterium]|nr:amidohydrolase family protein [Planctomycetota bacterium]